MVPAGALNTVLQWHGWAFLLSEWVIRLVMLAVVPFRRTPAAAKGWLLLIFFEPWIGLLLYALIGRPTMPRARVEQMARLPTAMAAVRERVLAHPGMFQHQPAEGLEWTVALAQKLGRMPLLGGNSAEVLVDYDAALARLAEDIDTATNTVHLLYFMFRADAATAPVIAALGRAAARGAKCRVLVDSLGSRTALPVLIPRLKSLGVDVREMLPVRLARLLRARLDLRNHRKIAVIDGRVAYTGSQNLVASDFVPGFRYEELALRLTGPAVLELQYLFGVDWFLEADEVLDGEGVYPAPNVAGSLPVQVLASGPDFATQNNQRFIVALIHAARNNITMISPYFIPDEPMLQALQTAVLRGVKVRLVFSAIEDQVLVAWAQKSYYEELLAGGVEINLYKRNFLHAKFMTVDDDLSLVGTSNLDTRSFVLNAEHILIIHDAGMNRRLDAEQRRYLSESRTLDLPSWRRRPFRVKFAEHLARLASPLL